MPDKFRTVITDDKGKVLIDEEYRTYSLDAAAGHARRRLPYNLKGDRLTITVERIAKAKVPTAKQLAARAKFSQRMQAAAQQQRAEWEKQHQEQVRRMQDLRRARIINQIELAFEKKGKDAAKFITCDNCSGVATLLHLVHTPEGSAIPFEDIAGAQCLTCAAIPAGVSVSAVRPNPHAYRAEACVPCEQIEFFYQGLRQLYINKEQ
jgi:hypothetical protein